MFLSSYISVLTLKYVQITEYRYLKVNYESVVDWKTQTDYLRCNPSFNHKERNDHVIIDTVDGPIFGQLLFIFVCTVDEKQYPIALVLPFDAGTGRRSKTRQERDRELGLWRFRAKPLNSAEFFSVHSFIRGAYMVDDHQSNEERAQVLPGTFKFAVDTIDSDMFLRMKKIVGTE